MVIDCAHYVAQLIWVTGETKESLVRIIHSPTYLLGWPHTGNMTWAMGMMFNADQMQDDSTFSLWKV